MKVCSNFGKPIKNYSSDTDRFVVLQVPDYYNEKMLKSFNDVIEATEWANACVQFNPEGNIIIRDLATDTYAVV